MLRNKYTHALFLGDLVILYASLYLALVVRYLNVPDREILAVHLLPFTILIAMWCAVFLVVGLYERHVIILKRSLPEIIVNTQIFNCVIAAVFFYFIPYFSVAPKTVLFIYLGISLGLILVWRLYIFQKLTSTSTQKAVVVGDGPETKEICDKLAHDKSYGLSVKKNLGLNEFVSLADTSDDTDILVADFSKKEIRDSISKIYNLIFSGVEFIKIQDLYESIFGRVAMSIVDHDWFVENVSSRQKAGYGVLKRAIDIFAAFLIAPFFIFFLPFVYLAIKIEDGGKIFIKQERVGKAGKIFTLFKFRSMNVDDAGAWIENGDKRHTKVGIFIRKTRIDELPQVLNLFFGDVSLIGPRPDIRKLWEDLSAQIPFYTVRNIVKPGLSGWAQITQELPPQNVDETRIRLSYDLYYIKHRSILLDLKIALRTIKTLISRTGV